MDQPSEWSLPPLYSILGPNDGPPSMRARSTTSRAYTLAAGPLASWDDECRLPLDYFEPFGYLCFHSAVVTSSAPTTYYERLQGDDAQEWREALTTHMVGKMANETCIFVPRPPGVTLVKSKLVPGLKFNPDGTIWERTMRWVGCGYSQVNGRDFDETYTATSKATSVRVFLCMTLNLGLKLRKMDVPKAFTKAKLDVTMYVSRRQLSCQESCAQR